MNKNEFKLFDSFDELIGSTDFANTQQIAGNQMFDFVFFRSKFDYGINISGSQHTYTISFTLAEFQRYIKVIEELFKRGERIYYRANRTICIDAVSSTGKKLEIEVPISYTFMLDREFKTPRVFEEYVLEVLTKVNDKKIDRKYCCSNCRKVCEEVKRCSRCRIGVYCSNECQKKNWMDHKKFCTKHGKCPVCKNVRVLRKCKKCRKKKYCSKECQTDDWEQHKRVCE